MEIRQVSEVFSVSPQIAPGNLATLRDRGFASVINNRPDGEEPGQPSGAEIEAAAVEAGLSYRAIPVAGGFAEAQVAEMAEAIAGSSGPVLAFCRSGTRSTLLWALAQAMGGREPGAIAADAAAAGYDITPVRAALEDLAARA